VPPTTIFLEALLRADCQMEEVLVVAIPLTAATMMRNLQLD